MNYRLAFAIVAVSLAACSHGAPILPAAVTTSIEKSAIRPATPPVTVALTGANLKFTTGTQATGFRFAGLLAQRVKLSVPGGTGDYTYALTTGSAAVTVAAGSTAGQFVVTPKAMASKISFKATATPAGGKTVATVFTLQIVPLVYATNYPGSSGQALGVYAPWSTKPIAQVPAIAPNALDVDKNGNVWLANGTNVVEYSAGLIKNLRTISGLGKANAIAVDALGNAYCVDNYAVKEFVPGGGSTPKRTFASPQGIDSATSVDVDSLNDVYVADYYSSAVWVFPAGTSTKPLRTLNTGVVNPRIVVVANNNVYVANNAPNSTIPRFPVGSTKPNLTYGTSSGVPGPTYMTVDSKGNVYAAIQNLGSGNVVEYTSTSVASPSRALDTLGGGSPNGLTTDPFNNLYVANSADYVDVFAPGTGTSPTYSIGGPSSGLYSPSAVAVWP